MPRPRLAPASIPVALPTLLSKVQSFAHSLQEKLALQPTTSNPDAKWSHLCGAIYDSAMTAFGKKVPKNADWFEACWVEMQPVTEAKRKAMLARKQNPSSSRRDTLQAARSKAQQTTRRCASEYWQNLRAKIQLTADCGREKGMYEGIKIATGPMSIKTAPLKSKTARSSLIKACSCSVGWTIISSSTQPRTSSQTLPSMP